MESPNRHHQQILEEIAHLERELASRRSSERPAPASVMHAYRVVLARQYERLGAGGDDLAAARSDERRGETDERDRSD